MCLIQFYLKEKQQRLVSYEHRYRMCELAFLHLNQDQSIDINVASQNKIKSKVLISNAEYLSWKYAVQNMYVSYALGVIILLKSLLLHSNSNFVL